jgi:hypothetical protein
MTMQRHVTPCVPTALPVRIRALAVACALAAAAQGAHADERSELESLRATTKSLIAALVENGLLSQDKADTIFKQAAESGQRAAASASAGTPEAAKPAVIRIPYLTETAKAELREQVKKEVLAQAKGERWGEPGALPEWLGRIKFEGDVRVRYQHDGFDPKNTAPDDLIQGYVRQDRATQAFAPDLLNTLNSRDRATLRARIGLHADLGQGFDTAVRLSTGNGTSPVSASQTEGNYFNKYTVLFDRAFLRYKSDGGLTATAGRFASPFYGSDLTFPGDLNLEGASVSYKPALGSDRSVFMTAGVFPLQELEISNKDKWLVGAQVGAALKVAPATTLRLGAALYDFQGVGGRQDTSIKPANVNAGVIPYAITEYPKGARQKGNSLIRLNNPDGFPDESASVWGLASRFRPLNLTADVNLLQFSPMAVNASFDYVRNLGFDIKDIRTRSGQPDLVLDRQTNAYQAKVTVGAEKVEKPGQWQTFLTFRRLERDAWIDAFTDTTWHLGGTNYQGWSLGGEYAIGSGANVGLRYTSTHNLTDRTVYSPSLSNAATLKIDVFQIELNTRF